MTAAIDIKGMLSGNLVAIESSPERQKRKILWRCRCDCGNEVLVLATSIRVGDKTACSRTCSARPQPNDHLKAFLERNAGKDGCWEWPAGFRDKDGYAHTKVNGERKGAHRAVYVYVNGSVPDGMNVCHRCDNPPCCRPDHLFAGTQKENCQDAKAKDRHTRGERQGNAKLTDDDVRFIRSKAGVMSQMDLARMFDIRQSSIWFIQNRKQWTHVAD